MIKTSKENREIVARLSRKLGLGSENHISRIAFSYSINSERKLNVSKISNSMGKVYSKSVFFGNNFDLYIGMVCMKYGIHSSDNDILKYIKLHVDDGLESLNEFVENQGIQNGFDLIKSITWTIFCLIFLS